MSARHCGLESDQKQCSLVSLGQTRHSMSIRPRGRVMDNKDAGNIIGGIRYFSEKFGSNLSAERWPLVTYIDVTSDLSHLNHHLQQLEVPLGDYGVSGIRSH